MLLNLHRSHAISNLADVNPNMRNASRTESCQWSIYENYNTTVSNRSFETKLPCAEHSHGAWNANRFVLFQMASNGHQCHYLAAPIFLEISLFKDQRTPSSTRTGNWAVQHSHHTLSMSRIGARASIGKITTALHCIPLDILAFDVVNFLQQSAIHKIFLDGCRLYYPRNDGHFSGFGPTQFN